MVNYSWNKHRRSIYEHTSVLKQFDAALNTINIARQIIKDGYKEGFEVFIKEDGSPVTTIDKKVDEEMRSILKKYFPEYGFLTEESKDDLSRLDKEFVWIIDPIDGTKEFVNHAYEFVTNLALCHNHEIVLSMILNPLTDEIFYAVKGEGAYLFKDNIATKIHVSNKLKDLTYLSSPYHQSEDEKNAIKEHQDIIKEIIPRGAAYKACLIASGKADISYRISPDSKEWDTAACDLLIKEAGGCFFDKNKKEFIYNKKDVRNLDGFIMLNKIENY